MIPSNEVTVRSDNSSFTYGEDGVTNGAVRGGGKVYLSDTVITDSYEVIGEAIFRGTLSIEGTLKIEGKVTIK